MRVVVGKRCEGPCPSCTVCDPAFVAPSADDVIRTVGDAAEVTLGGGDATRWPGLEAFLSAKRGRVRLEAPLTAFSGSNAARLARLGVAEAIVLIDVSQLERTRDDEVVARVAEIERQGLPVTPRLCARPVAFGRLAAITEALAPG